MTKEEKIKAIYDKIADKTLSFGCIVRMCSSYALTDKGEYISMGAMGPLINIEKKFWTKTEGLIGKDKLTIIDKSYSRENEWRTKDNSFGNGIYEIIGHPVMIGDVLDYIEEKEKIDWGRFTQMVVIEKWNKKRKPLEEQSEECIDYIYNLLPKE